MQRSEKLFITEMIQAIGKIREIVDSTTSEELSQDSILQDALLWNFSVLGEAASKLSEDFRRDNDQVNWRRPIDMRNRIIHGYWSIDIDLLVVTAEDDLPEYQASLRAILERL